MKKAALLLCMVILCGCASPAYRQVLREEPKYNMREFAASKGLMYQAVTRALLSKNFMIENEEIDKGFILARRSFQKGRKTDVILVQTKIMPINDTRCTVYLNGVEVSVKQREKVICDKRFYDTFFSSIDEELAYVKAAQPPSEVSAAFEKLAHDVQMPQEEPEGTRLEE